jgi:hypothetical protein
MMLNFSNAVRIAGDEEVLVFRVDGNADYVFCAPPDVKSAQEWVTIWFSNDMPKIAIDDHLVDVLRGRGHWGGMASLSEMVGEEFALAIIEDWREVDPRATKKMKRATRQRRRANADSPPVDDALEPVIVPSAFCVTL